MKYLAIMILLIAASPVFASEYVEYVQGDCPLLIEVPHDGTLLLYSIPVRMITEESKSFSTGRDTGTAQLAKEVTRIIKTKTGKTPYLVIMKLSRKQLDVNRAPKEAYDHHDAGAVYNEYYALLEKVKAEILLKFGKGLLLDIHCSGSWKHDIYFGTSKENRSITTFITKQGKEAYTGKNSIQYQMNKAGYEVPGFGGVPAEEGPAGTIIKTLTWGSTDKRLDGIEIEIQRKKHLMKEDTIKAFAANLANAVIVFTGEYY
jgi:N-formylglutamate amidohydrolase